MVRRNTTLYIEDVLIQKAKLSGLNLSRFLETQLANYLDSANTKTQIKNNIDKLELQLAEHKTKMEKIREEEESIKQQIPEEELNESLLIIKEDRTLAIGRSRLLSNKHGLKVTPEMLLRWANE